MEDQLRQAGWDLPSDTQRRPSARPPRGLWDRVTGWVLLGSVAFGFLSGALSTQIGVSVDWRVVAGVKEGEPQEAGPFLAIGHIYGMDPEKYSVAYWVHKERPECPLFLVMSGFDVPQSGEGGGWGSTCPEAKFKFEGKEIPVPVSVPAQSYLWRFPQVREHNVFILKRDGSLARLPVTLRTKAQMDRILDEVIFNRNCVDPRKGVLRVLGVEDTDIQAGPPEFPPQHEEGRPKTSISYGYPDSLADCAITAGVWGLLIVLTWWIVRNRRLPHGYALYGLLFLTGTVYVLTLDRRADDAPAFRKSVATRLARHPVLLGTLTFVMFGLLAGDALFVLILLLAPITQPAIYVNGREVQGLLYLLPFLLMSLYFVSVGLFHFTRTRKRVKTLVKTLTC